MINERATATKQPAESGHQATGVLQRACACGRHSGSGGECAECRKKRLGLQRRAVNNSGPEIAPPIVHEVLRSPGRPLDDATRGFMESRFNHDFSGVRVHNDERAAESARAVNALAYTVGNHVAFGAGQYAPGTILGRKMLAHELSHVVQQINGTAIDQLNGIKVDGVDTVWEQEATLIADSLTSTYSEPIHHTRTNRSLQRQDTRPGAPVVVPEIASLPANLYVDTFVEVHYDLSYRSVEGNLSTWLQVMYQDGTFIDISIYDIDDTRVNPHDALQMMANGRLGLGGRIFPQHLNSSTTPRLAAAKGEAIRIMEEYNFQYYGCRHDRTVAFNKAVSGLT
jgi:hypothetical protein